MSDQFLSDNLPTDRLETFTNREHILNQFERSLRLCQSGQFHLLAIKGGPGSGKTFLIEYLSRKVCSSFGWQTGILAFSEAMPDFRSILEDLEDALKVCVPRELLKQYRTRRDEYYHRFDEYHASITINQTIEAEGSSSVSQSSLNAQVNADLRRRELHLRAELSRALIELAEESQHPLCFFIDGYERLVEAGPGIVGWLWEVLLNLARTTPQPLLIVTCGWQWPSSATIKPFMDIAELDEFDSGRIRSYLQKQNILPPNPSSPREEELVAAFYDLTKGHPLVLSLAVTYFGTLDVQERTAVNLRADRSLLDEKARIEFVQERLLARLQEPYRTLLEHGPILRSFDQAALQMLLSDEPEGITDGLHKLEDQTYDHFLSYPFIKQNRIAGQDSGEIQQTFHELVRWIGLSALRRHHAQTEQQLHRRMAEYYRKMVEAEQKSEADRTVSGSKNTDKKEKFRGDYTKWLAKIPEREFRALLEYLYHGLQVRELQADAFKEWSGLTWRAVSRWQQLQAIPLLELVRLLAEEGEPFLSETDDPFNQYLLCYSRFLIQEAHWEDARVILVKAADYFEQVGNIADLAFCLNDTAHIYQQQGKLEQSVNYWKRALALYEQVGNPSFLAGCLSNVGLIYHRQGKSRESLSYYERALLLLEQLGDSIQIAYILNNMGGTYIELKEWKQALHCHERAQELFEQKGDLLGTAYALNNIGRTYMKQGEARPALNYYERSLALREQIDNPAATATALSNIGEAYYYLGKPVQALAYIEQSLTLREKVGNPAEIAVSLNNIGYIYASQGKLKEALEYHERSLALKKQVGNPIETAISHDNIGNIYLEQKKLEYAIEHFTKALDIYKALGHGFELDFADKLEKLAACYFQLGELEKAVNYYIRAKQIREEIKKTS